MKENQQALIQIGEVAKKCGISVRRVRYLSDQKYIQEPFKSVSGDICYRLYSQAHIDQIKQIKVLQDEGYTLKAAVQKMKEKNYAQ